MKNHNIPETLGIVISLCGVIVMTGWFWTSMGFATAHLFFLSGIMLFFIARFQKNDRELAIIIVPITSLAIFMITTSLIASTVIGINVGIEEIFSKASMEKVAPDSAYIVTMFIFILIAIAGLLTTLDINGLRKALTLLGITVAVVGLTSLFYFSAPGGPNAMALPVAMLFTLWGTGVVLTERAG